MYDSCIGVDLVTSYGDDCTSILDTWVTALGVPTALCKGDACNDDITCFENNDPSAPSVSGIINCDLVPIGNGYSQW